MVLTALSKTPTNGEYTIKNRLSVIKAGLLVTILLLNAPPLCNSFISHNHIPTTRSGTYSLSHSQPTAFLSTDRHFPSQSHGQRAPLLSSTSSTSSTSSEPATTSSTNGESTTTTLPAIPEEWRGEVLSALSSIIDPDLNRDIVTLGFIKNLTLSTPNSASRTISFDLELTTPACPIKDQFLNDAESAVLSLPWTTDTRVTLTAQPTSTQDRNDPTLSGLSRVSSIIAVTSCKGGVGKSTTAVNLAFALRGLNARVGIFDVDLYGPSLPTMVTPESDVVQFVGRQIAPLRRDGVNMMSFGYVNDGTAIMRGPMVTQLLDQFTEVTNWGELDYLILDMPPGTGDVQLTMCQKLNITAAVIVTTPQELSFVDVVRGVDMFQEVNVPCVAVVENMAYFEPPTSVTTSAITDDSHDSHDWDWDELKNQFVETLKDSDSATTLADTLVNIVKTQNQQQKPPSPSTPSTPSTTEKIQIFGKGHKHRLSSQYGIEHTFSIPLDPSVSSSGDSGTPHILRYPSSPLSQTYRQLAQSVVQEVAKIKFDPPIFRLDFDQDQNCLTVRDGKKEAVLSPPAILRQECRCASCVEELTGRQILIKESVREDVAPLSIAPCGNYAVSVNWSDGHRSLYPFKQIRGIVDEKGVVTDHGEGETKEVEGE